MPSVRGNASFIPNDDQTATAALASGGTSTQPESQPAIAATLQPSVSAPSLSVEVPKDVDHLVQEIKENLKLGLHHHNHFAPSLQQSASNAGPLKGSARSSLLASPRPRSGKAHRATPYAVPPTSRCANAENGAGCGSGGEEGPSQLRRWNHRRRYPSTCMAQTGGKSAKVAVDPDDPFEMLQELISDGSLIKEAVRRLQLGLTPKLSALGDGGKQGQKTFYVDSDDDDEYCRTPPAVAEAAEDVTFCQAI